MDGQPILYVSHDEEDGMWQFLDDNELDTDNALIISLKEIIKIDPSIVELSDLSLGWIAWRENEQQKWNREKV
ncbi:hypothetical protein JQN58_12800 [Aneurinibacillus sp. BA2021]|nr:hypothetical protein [Aneurinibacillus sp. BA2021]